jgi:hypothetical protein
VDINLPVSETAAPVHIYSADLQGLAALHATGADGEQYCVIDSEALINNPANREYARRAYLKACAIAHRHRGRFAT